MSLLHPHRADATGNHLRAETEQLAAAAEQPNHRAFWTALSTLDPDAYSSVTERVSAFLDLVTEHLGGDPVAAAGVPAAVQQQGR